MLHQSRQFQGIIHFFGVLNAISWAISETHNENQNPPFCAGGQKVPRDLYIYIQRQANRGLLRSIRNGVVHLNALRIYRFDNGDRFPTSGLWLPDIVIDKTIYMSRGHDTGRDYVVIALCDICGPRLWILHNLHSLEMLCPFYRLHMRFIEQ